MTIVLDFARKRAELSPRAIAFEDGETGATVTFAAVEDEACRLAGVLAGIGTSGDRIAVLSHNSWRFFALMMAAAKADRILVPLNWRLAADELVPILTDCAASILIHDAATAPLAEALAPRIPCPVTSERVIERQATDVRPVPGPGAWPADRAWYLLYTSGTTGQPKAVMQTFGMAVANYLMIQQATGMHAGDVTVNFLPLFHTAGINLHTLPLFFAGGRSIVLGKFDSAPLLAHIVSGRVSLVFAVPAVYQALAAHPGFDTLDLTRVRHWACGGAPLPEALIRRFLGKGVRVCNGMGMTETGPTVFLMDPERAVEKIGSVGRPQFQADVRLVDAGGRDVADGEQGEMLFRGPAITPGYFNNPQATAAAFTADGWLRSGDVGRRDADGFYYVVDRIKDMYISGGENVYPAEVENVLCDHPAVAEAAVIGIPDARWGEVGAALLRLRPGCTVTPDEIADFVRTRLAAYKVPRQVRVVDDYPRTAAGKVQKHVLRQLLAG